MVDDRRCEASCWLVLPFLLHPSQLTWFITGILTIFAWRIFAKFLLHRILPPTFRFLAQLVTLPHRRYYTPATDYTNVPQDKGLRAIPSVLDLPGMFELEMDGVSTARAVDPLTARRRDIKLRNGGGRGVGKSEKFADGFAQEGLGLGIEEMGGKEADVVKHYDADGKRHFLPLRLTGCLLHAVAFSSHKGGCVLRHWDARLWRDAHLLRGDWVGNESELSQGPIRLFFLPFRSSS